MVNMALLSREARRHLRSEQTPRGYFELLMARELWADAIRALAAALPRRPAVWWGCLCAWEMARHGSSAVEEEALAATIGWVQEPTEAHRRAAEAAAERATLRTPAGCLAQAAFWNGAGSMLAPELPEVRPAGLALPRLVAGAILLAAVQRDVNDYQQHYRLFLGLGTEIAYGRHLWTGPAASAPVVVASTVATMASAAQGTYDGCKTLHEVKA